MTRLVRPMQDRAASGSAERGLNLAYDYRRTIGGRIRSMRLAKSMTQRELGDRLGIGETGISAMESGRSSISPERYEEIRDIFGLDPIEWGTFLLRYTDPWIYVLMGLGKKDAALKRDLADLAESSRLGKSRGPTQR